jgi:hypothetical protein
MDALEVDYSWAAGFLDGEGWVGAATTGTKCRVSGQPYRRPSMSAAQNVNEPLIKLEGLLGGGIFYNDRERVCRWQLGGAIGVKSALEKVLPYLVVKKRQAELLVAYCDLFIPNDRKPKSQEIWDRRADIESQLAVARTLDWRSVV